MPENIEGWKHIVIHPSSFGAVSGCLALSDHDMNSDTAALAFGGSSTGCWVDSDCDSASCIDWNAADMPAITCSRCLFLDSNVAIVVSLRAR